MDAQDFIRLNGLVAKLALAANQTAKANGSFRRYNTESMQALRSFQSHLSQLEDGLKTANLNAQQEHESPETEGTESLQRSTTTV